MRDLTPIEWHQINGGLDPYVSAAIGASVGAIYGTTLGIQDVMHFYITLFEEHHLKTSDDFTKIMESTMQYALWRTGLMTGICCLAGYFILK